MQHNNSKAFTELDFDPKDPPEYPDNPTDMDCFYHNGKNRPLIV